MPRDSTQSANTTEVLCGFLDMMHDRKLNIFGQTKIATLSCIGSHHRAIRLVRPIILVKSMEKEASVPERLRILRERSGLSGREIARRLRVPSSTYQHLESRFKKRYLPLDMAERIATAMAGTPVSREEVFALSGLEVGPEKKGRRNPHLIQISDVSGHTKVGPFHGYESSAYSLAFPADYLAKLTRALPKDLLIISVHGDSMAPTLVDDDVVIVDASKTNVDYAGLFAIRMGEALQVKRLVRSATKDHITAISDNRSLYDPVDCPVNDVQVIGKVIWYGRKV
jgi:phage repressor protein C with HTH and peptisase S24 domain